MKSDRRKLEPWEVAECLALKSEISAYNSRLPKDQRLTQEHLAEIFGTSQGNVSALLNGHRPLNLDVAVKIAETLGIPVASFSDRFAAEVARLAKVGSADKHQSHGFTGPDVFEETRVPLTVSPHAQAVIERITAAAASGRLSDADVALLIKYLPASKAVQHGKCQARPATNVLGISFKKMIQTLQRSAFAGALRAPKVTGINPLFRAKIRVSGQSIRCYVKPLPDRIICPATRTEVLNQELPSEALGYVLAKSCGFAVPDVAGVILLDREQLPETVASALQLSTPGGLQDSYLCWFSKDMEYPNLVQKHLDNVQVQFLRNRRMKRLVAELIKSEESPRVIAFDDWLHNSDRHPGNLLSIGERAMMLIDHGRLLIYPNWTPGTLGRLPGTTPHENRLKSLIDSFESGWSVKLPNKSKIMLAYNSFSVSYRTGGETATRTALAHFFEAAEVDAIASLIKSQHNPAAYAKSNGMVL